MPDSVRTITINAAGDDAVAFHNNSGFTTNQAGAGWLPWQQHVNNTLATVTGYRFLIPSDIPAADITDVRLRLVANGTATTAFGAAFDIRVEKTAIAFADTTGGRPSNRHVDAISAGASLVSWTPPGSVTASTEFTGTFPDISTPIKAAMTDGGYVAGTTYVGVLAKAPIGGPVTIQAKCQENATSGHRPQLIITYTVPVTNVNITPSPVAVSTTVRTPTTWTALYSSSISYTNGAALIAKDTTDSGSRTMRVWRPQFGPAPGAGGHKVFAWFHGGFGSSGDMATIPMPLVIEMLQRGYLVVSINYRLVELILDGFEFLASGNEASFPLAVHDGKVALRYLANDRAGANVWNADVNELIVSGFSYGGQVAQFLAYSKGDTNSYVGMSPTEWTSGIRPAHVARSNNSTYTFDFTQNNDFGINGYTVKGMFLWAGATDLGLGVDATATPNSDARIAISNGRRANVSRDVVPSTIVTTVYEELDANKYLAPAGGTPTINQPYLGTTRTVPNYPIGYARGTSDVLVTKAAGYDSLVTALTSIGYIASPPTTDASNPTGLSYYEVSGVDHDGMESNPGGLAAFVSWMNAAFAASTDATVLPSAVAATVTIPARTPAAAAQVAPAAVARTVAIPARSMVTGVSSSPAAVTATAQVRTPSVSAGGNAIVTPAAVAATASIPARTVNAGATASASLVASFVVVPAIGVATGGSVTTSPAAVAVVTAVPSPAVTVSTNAAISPAAVAVTTTIPAALASAGGSVTVTPATVTAIVAIPGRAIRTGATAIVVPVNATATIPARSMVTNIALTPAAVNVLVLARTALAGDGSFIAAAKKIAMSSSTSIRVR